MTDMITANDPITGGWPAPTHRTTEAQWLRWRAEDYERRFTALIDTDPEAAEQYWQTAKLLQERANLVEFHQYNRPIFIVSHTWAAQHLNVEKTGFTPAMDKAFGWGEWKLV